MTRPLSRFLLAACAVGAVSAAPALAAEPSTPLPSSQAALSGNASLTVRIIGLSEREGQVLVGLYNSERGFEDENDIMGRTVPVDAATESVTFNGIPEGEYALKVFHDEDSDGKLDTTLGIPSEPYGFSNNASDPFSAPEWEETVFTVSGASTTHEIDLD